MKRTLVNMALTAAVVVAGMAPQSEAVANQVVQIGAATSRINYLPYMEYYAFGRTATLYSEKEIAANGGGPGRITRVEWFSDGYLDYGSYVYDYGAFNDKLAGKEVELFMGTRASEQFPVNMFTQRLPLWIL